MHIQANRKGWARSWLLIYTYTLEHLKYTRTEPAMCVSDVSWYARHCSYKKTIIVMGKHSQKRCLSIRNVHNLISASLSTDTHSSGLIFTTCEFHYGKHLVNSKKLINYSRNFLSMECLNILENICARSVYPHRFMGSLWLMRETFELMDRSARVIGSEW